MDPNELYDVLFMCRRTQLPAGGRSTLDPVVRWTQTSSLSFVPMWLVAAMAQGTRY